MNLDLLKTFLAVARHSSFTRAAEERLLTQPATSRQIQQLESLLGVVLFERLGKSIDLTDAGRELLAQAEDLLGRMDRLAESVREFGTAERGRLRIGASTTPGYYLLPPILGRFHRAHPDVELEFVIDNTRQIEQRIVRNELDLAFVGAKPTHPGLCAERWREDEIVCFCGPGHELAHRKRIAAGSLQGALWVVREKGSATRLHFERRLARLRAPLTRTIELGSPEGIKALVEAGIGLSFLSLAGIQAELRQVRLIRLPLDLQVTRPIYLLRHRQKCDTPPMQVMLSLLDSSMCPLKGQLES